MKRTILALTLVIMFVSVAWAQQTPGSLAQSYSSLADAMIAMKQAEADLVRSVLDHHRRAADAAMQRGDAAAAAAEMALFANEGDNTIGGIRKRLVDAGHHHHAGGDAQAVYETGYVIVTIAAKQEILAASAALRQASSDSERRQAWDRFETAATELLGS